MYLLLTVNLLLHSQKTVSNRQDSFEEIATIQSGRVLLEIFKGRQSLVKKLFDKNATDKFESAFHVD